MAKTLDPLIVSLAFSLARAVITMLPIRAFMQLLELFMSNFKIVLLMGALIGAFVYRFQQQIGREVTLLFITPLSAFTLSAIAIIFPDAMPRILVGAAAMAAGLLASYIGPKYSAWTGFLGPIVFMLLIAVPIAVINSLF